MINVKGQNYINGKFSNGALNRYEKFDNFNPSNEKIIGSFTQSNQAYVDDAISHAQKAFDKWKKLSKIQRAEYFWKLAKVLENKIDYVAEAISLETGKSLNESKAEVIEALHMAQFCFGKGRESSGDIIPSEIPERDSFVIRKPKGVIAVIAPWNFPFAIGGFWNACPSILEGNTVILKPSELAPLTGEITAELFHEAGFPEGVFNLLHGDGRTGKLLVEDKRIAHIAFTGSREVADEIKVSCAKISGRTCNCEMGSKSAVIVFEDGDLDLAATACLNSAFKLSGQRCVSAGRLLVQRTVFEQFKQKFLPLVDDVVVASPDADLTEYEYSLVYGPLISEEQMNKVKKFNDMVRNDPSANVLHDPDKEENLVDVCYENGYWLRPFVYEVEWGDKEYLKKEVFGPHVAIIPFDTIEDAINIYNDTDFGLSLGVITNDYRKMREVRNSCDAGMIYFNLGSIGAETHQVFGGVKASGYGGSSAAGMFDNVVHKIAVTVNHAQTVNFPQGLK